MTPGHSHRLHALRYQRETVSAISMKRVSAIGAMRNKGSLRWAVPALDNVHRTEVADAPGLEGSARSQPEHQSEWIEWR
jgi:hypothetical protein